MKYDVSQNIHGNMIFFVYMYKCYKYGITLLPKIAKIIFSQKNTCKGDITGITEEDDIHSIRYGFSVETPC